MPIYRLPPYTTQQVMITLAQTIDWGVAYLKVPDVWGRTKGRGVTVAVIDTGVDSGHPDLVGAVIESRDFTGSGFGEADRQGHGTHCAGIIAARNNDTGIVGIAPECSIISAKVLGDDGSGLGEWIAAGIDWACAMGADVLSMSLGSPQPDPIIHAAVKRAVECGKFVVCAAGNDGLPASVNFPAAYTEPVIVGSIDRHGKLSPFSSRGPEMRERGVVAPGSDITSTFPGHRYAKLSGTSMATPAVAGVTALMIARHRDLGKNSRTPLTTQAELLAHLRARTIDAGPAGPDDGYGMGAPNVAELIAAEQDNSIDNATLVAEFGGFRVYAPSRIGDRVSIDWGE